MNWYNQMSREKAGLTTLFNSSGFTSFGLSCIPLELYVRYGHNFVVKQEISFASEKLCKHGHRIDDGFHSLRLAKSKHECVVCRTIATQKQVDSGMNAKYRAAAYARDKDSHNMKCLDRYHCNREEIRAKQDALREKKRAKVQSGEVSQFYHGKPCKRCSETLRYVISSDCVKCAKARTAQNASKYQEKKNEGTRRWRDRKQSGFVAPYSAEDLNRLLSSFNHECAYCGKDLETAKKGEKSFDHVIPFTMDGADVIKNMVPVCRSCNSSKQGKLMITWYRNQEFFDQYRLDRILVHLEN